MSAIALSWLAYLLNALWQVPLVFLAALLVARLVRPLGAQPEHRVWVAALVAEVVLPAVQVRAFSWLHWPIPAGSSAGLVSVTFSPAVIAGARSQIGEAAFVAVVALHAGWLLYAALRLLWGLWRVRALAREAHPLHLTAETAIAWEQACSQTPPQQRPALATSPHVVGPLTLGMRRPMLLVPEGFAETLSHTDLQATFAHELAHCARADVAKHLLYSVLALPLGWHPALRATSRQIAATRELVCDGIAAPAAGGRKPYARSLLRIAAALGGPHPVAGLPAIGFLEPRSFERRIMSLAQPASTIGRARRIAAVATAVLAAVLTCSSAVALRLEPPAASGMRSAQPVQVPAGDMAGMRIAGENPTYPAEARQKKIQGKVTLALVINEQGDPEDIHVVSSPSDLLTESAITAVRTWRWKPYTVDEKPVPVETTVNVIYNLAG